MATSSAVPSQAEIVTTGRNSVITPRTAPVSLSAAAVHERAAEVLRPSGALAWLDEIAAWVAGWQRTDRPRIARPVGLIFAADHGIAAATKVSAYPTGVTEAMLAAFREGRSTISAFARHAGASVEAIDVGVGRPTADIRYEAALSPERFDEVVRTLADDGA